MTSGIHIQLLDLCVAMVTNRVVREMYDKFMGEDDKEKEQSRRVIETMIKRLAPSEETAAPLEELYRKLGYLRSLESFSFITGDHAIHAEFKVPHYTHTTLTLHYTTLHHPYNTL